MKAEAIMVTPKDNVVTVVHGAKAGEEVHYFKGAELCSVITTEDIPPATKSQWPPLQRANISSNTVRSSAAPRSTSPWGAGSLT